MNLKQIRDECWDIARETSEMDSDRLWSLNEMNAYINRIYRDIARTTKIIIDSTTVSTCQITLSSATPIFALSPLILSVHDCYYCATQTSVPISKKLIYVPVICLGVDPMLITLHATPTYYSLDNATGNITFDTIPLSADVTPLLKLRVSRLPLLDLIEDIDIPEFLVKYHDYFKYGVLWLMYSKQDSEAYDLAKASDFYQMYQLDIAKLVDNNSYTRNTYGHKQGSQPIQKSNGEQ
jgi:hypothetical protein